MPFVDVDTAVRHCRANAYDKPEITDKLAAAERAVCQRLNRAVFKTDAEMAAAWEAMPALLSAARASYTADMEAANLIPDVFEADDLRRLATRKYEMVKARQRAALNGIVADFDIVAATLLICGHLFANRESVVVGQGAGATEVPDAAAALLAPHVKLEVAPDVFASWQTQ